MALVLAGDIGGTKTLLALFEEGRVDSPLFLESFPSQKFSGLSDVVEAYLAKIDCKQKIEKALFAIAGPILNQKVKTTNLPWQVDSALLKEELRMKSLWLVNDLEASAYGIDALPEEAFFQLTSIHEKRLGNRVIVSPGTGLGEAGIFFDGKEYHPFATEGGHADFAPDDDLQIELLSYLKGRFGHISYERLLSGSGFPLLLDFFVNEKKRVLENALLKEMEGQDPAAIIVKAAEKGQSLLCSDIVNLFATMLGQEASNAALKMNALGGVFLGGGIPRKILPQLQQGYFLNGFFNKGRFNSLLQSMPIYVILDPLSSLKGAALLLSKK